MPYNPENWGCPLALPLLSPSIVKETMFAGLVPRRRISLFLCFLWALPVCSPLLAQTVSSDATSIRASTPPPAPGRNEFGVWAGYSPHSFVLEGTSLHRHLFLLNLEYARVLGSRGPFTLKYTAEVIPLALETQPTTYYIVHQKVLRNSAGTVFGAGANPLGFQVNLGHRRIQPFTNSSIGFLYFNRQVPAPDSSQFNFTFNFGGGVQFFSTSGRTFTVGYKYHHLSNADTGIINPGIDSNVIYVGFSLVGWKRAH